MELTAKVTYAYQDSKQDARCFIVFREELRCSFFFYMGAIMKIEDYYNKFNEDKRLSSRHGQVEFRVSWKYIHEYLHEGDKILDIGAATGGYSIPLYDEGYDVTAVELVQHNLGRLKAKCPGVKAYKGNAVNLKRFADNSFDLTLLFGPMYHLISYKDKLAALSEARRVTRPGGTILVAYIMNEYSVITYGFKERHIMELIEEDRIDASFRVAPKEGELYDYVRLEDIDQLNNDAGLSRIKIISPDGPANLMRPFLNQLSEAEFEQFVRYQMSVCERPELLGAGGHVVDILRA